MADIDKILKSVLNIKIIKFFHENQASIDTPRGVATWTGEDRAKVQQALEELVKLKVLVAHRATSTTGYSYTRDGKLILKIEKILNNALSDDLDDRRDACLDWLKPANQPLSSNRESADNFPGHPERSRHSKRSRG